MLNSKLLLAILFATTLSACGGGGGESESPAPTPAPIPAPDNDNDGTPDSSDNDDDNDGVNDADDALPFDSAESVDTDSDGIGNNADEDDDNDGVNDVDDMFPLDASETIDTDLDGIGNNADEDDDNDAVNDSDDAFPLDASETTDTDADGIGNNTDEDDDNDSVNDTNDAFPLDSNESSDTDEDGVGDNGDFYAQDASCWKEQNGDGNQCYLTVIKADLDNEQVFSFDDRIVFFNHSNSRLIELKADTGDFDAPVALALNNFDLLSAIEYSAQQDVYYIGTSSGLIYQMESDSSLTELYQHSSPISQVGMAGNWIVTTDIYGALVILDINGTLLSSNYTGASSPIFEWDSHRGTLYVTESQADRYALLEKYEISPEDGSVVSYAYGRLEERVSADTSLIIPPMESDLFLYNGNFINKDTLQKVNESEINQAFFVWLDDFGSIALSYSAGNSLLSWFDNSLSHLSDNIIEGAPIAMASHSNTVMFVTNTLRNLKLNYYAVAEDADNDGVANVDDAFPVDIAASVDIDLDGHPDAWNEGYGEGDSTEELSLDMFPSEASCWLSEHADSAGNCDFSASMGEFVPSQVMSGPDDLVYIYDDTSGIVFVFDALNDVYMRPVNIKIQGQFFEYIPSQISFSHDHNRLYFTDNVNTVYFSENLNGEFGVPEQFADLSEQGSFYNEPFKLVGNFMLVQMLEDYYQKLVLLDINGNITDETNSSYSMGNAVWHQDNERLYYLEPFSYSSRLHSIEVDQTQGTLGQTISSSYYNITQEPIFISADRSKLSVGSGQVFNAGTLRLETNTTSFDAAVNLDNGQTLYAINDANGSLIVRLNTRQERLETLSQNLAVSGMFNTQSYTIIWSNTDTGFLIEKYLVNDDSDADGVTNLDDAFPADISASVDTDNDGYPDAWNTGYSQNDSTILLALDAFPLDTACWLDEHAATDGSCDLTATMPVFSADFTTVDTAGIIYLFSEGSQFVYRWDTQSLTYLNPLAVGRNIGTQNLFPVEMIYLESHQRLYLGYSDGQITYLEPQDNASEQTVINLGGEISELINAGNFLYVQHYASSSLVGSLIDINGTATDTDDSPTQSRAFAWNSYNNRLYQFRDNTSPNDLVYKDIDQVSGLFTAYGNSPYHGDYYIFPPIIISSDGQRVILGSGDIYDAQTLVWLGSHGRFDQAITLDNGEILFITQDGTNITIVRKDQNSRVLEERVLVADEISIVNTGSEYQIVLTSDQGFDFIEYTANNDSDNDGVANSEDTFPTDPAASIDTDNDGYPDQWNDGYSQADSTTGLTLDAFAADSACWFDEHATPEGSCDFGATMPNFSPAQILSDEAGDLYLFNNENSTVYRWSSQTQSFINPIYVGQSSGLNTIAPIKLSYSQAHQRIYFGYNDGQITFVDLDGSASEQEYYRLPLSVDGLLAAGDYVLAQDSSGAWNTHYIIDQFGNLTDSAEWNRYSREYAWNATNSRAFFFRDQTSPNDLHYEEIDQANGIISDSGETPYHSSQNIQTPIRVINSGQNVLLGSGAIYDATSLELVHSLGHSLEDGVSFDSVFTVVATTDDVQELKVYSNSDWSLQYTRALAQPVLGIYAWGEKLVMVSLINNEFSFEFIEFGDNDADGLPAWWEEAYGLSDANASDAGLDDDTDGLSNAEEFDLSTNPTLSDSDDDGLSDGDEYTLYATNPLVLDSDGDKLSDGDEVLIYNTLPLASDTDSDSFSDGDEVLLYDTDPTDAASLPEALTMLLESFEGGVIPSIFTSNDNNDADWMLSDFEPTDGLQSVRSGDIGDSERSSLMFQGLFAAGVLTFDAKVSSESCCDHLYVYVNDVQMLQIRNGDWANYSINISAGETTIEWRYTKDGSVSNGEDSAFIDNLIFN